ncbi:MAG: type I DNA topoisomerase [Clostridia bacterium]|nr:type I DNA topoisomerase [Clostridia bacterium]MDD4375611.1 type I DNA topoisomerase [Clostridia bacterium]
MEKKLVIVESPSKAKTIKKYLGKDFDVIASQGHVIDLPASRMGVDLENDFKPEYIKMKGKAKIINEIKSQAKNKETVYLATDPDREGEAIAWHLKNELGIESSKKCRIEFNEITKDAVTKAVESARKIDIDLVNAQQARRILDRIVGYKLSPVLWKKVKTGLSAGRVQSVALRIIMDREFEIRNFKPEEYWNLNVILNSKNNESDIFAKFYGDVKGKIELKEEKQVNEIVKTIDGKEYIVEDIKKSEKKKNPPAPFTTSSLQQDASRKFGFPVKKTMMIAQKLYEMGYITYMRTDSIRISDVALSMAKKHILTSFGKEYYQVRVFKGKSGAQDAHEAIRPTSLDTNILNTLDKDTLKLYTLIYNRFLASQMSVAIYDTVRVRINVQDYIFYANGSTIKFDGFLKLYMESKDEKKTEKDDEEDVSEERTLPELILNEVLVQKKLNFEQKFTEPPARYTEASLVKVLEEKGIGRPSTYAPTISTIIDRFYVEKEKRYLVPTNLGEVVNDIMIKYFKDVVDVTFTADMETKLDEISEGKIDYIEMLRNFYNPFNKNLEEVQDIIPRAELKAEETDVICELCGRNMVIKQGRFGKFLACPGYPECKNAKPIVEEIKEPCPQCGGKVLIRKTKTKRNFYLCENNTNDDKKTCDYISWNKPGAEDKKSTTKKKTVKKQTSKKTENKVKKTKKDI